MPPSILRQWCLEEQDTKGARELVHALGLHPITARILASRGFEDPDKARTFLNPSLDDLHDPNLMRDMNRAVHRTLEAFRDSDPILVYGDSDVDGVTAAACVYQFLKRLGVDVRSRIPVRTDEGYGLTISAVREAHAAGVRLLITTDCGVANVASIALAKALGVDVIVIDHHTLPPELPSASAVLDPLRPDCRFPFTQMAAVGVAFNYVMALHKALCELGAFPNKAPSLRAYMDMVAMGTVADAVPLVDENRVFVRLGLEVLRRRHRPGIQALMERAQVEGRLVTARTIGYRLAPLINAAGRMGDANRCVDLLTTDSYRKALKLARELERDNIKRQHCERELLKEALEMAEEQHAQGRHILMLSGEGWHEGVLGIVASRVKEAFHKPSAVGAINPETRMTRVSLRATEGVDLIEALSSVEGRLKTFGGHVAAAGMTLHADDVEEVSEALNAAIASQRDRRLTPRLALDTEARLEELSDVFLDDLQRLAPFGVGNPEPMLLVRDVRCVRKRVVGERHLRVQLRGGSAVVDAIGFALADQYEVLSGPLDAALTPRYTMYCGRPKLELQLKALRPAQHIAQDAAS